MSRNTLIVPLIEYSSARVLCNGLRALRHRPDETVTTPEGALVEIEFLEPPASIMNYPEFVDDLLSRISKAVGVSGYD